MRPFFRLNSLSSLSKTSINLTPQLCTTKRFIHSAETILSNLGLSDYNQGVFNGSWTGNGPDLKTYNPSTNEEIATIKTGTANDFESCVSSMDSIKREWSLVPAPKRGEIVRNIGLKLREKKEYLGALISLENGKILAEGLGEVQEVIFYTFIYILFTFISNPFVTYFFICFYLLCTLCYILKKK